MKERTASVLWPSLRTALRPCRGIGKAATIADLADMAVLRSFTEIVEATAQQKLAAAQARNNPDANAEKPREAILDALNMVAGVVAAEGYDFFRSGPRFARKCSDFRFEISVHSDHNNVAGKRAAIWVYAVVYSKTLATWRKKHPSEWVRLKTNANAPLFTSQLGYLCKPASWMEWDFANKVERRAIVDDLIGSIRAGAFPLFTTFGGPIEGVAAIVDRDLTPTESILSYLLLTGRPDLAEKALGRHLDKKPGFRAQFEKLFHQFSDQGFPPYRAASGAHDLAAFAVATGYPWRRTGPVPG